MSAPAHSVPLLGNTSYTALVDTFQADGMQILTNKTHDLSAVSLGKKYDYCSMTQIADTTPFVLLKAVVAQWPAPHIIQRASGRGVIIQAAGDQDLGVKFFVMAAEVAISCGDPTEAQLACSAVTQAVDDSASSDHLTLFDQASFHERIS